MMENITIQQWDMLEELLQQKQFKQLNPDERKEVLSFLSEDTYDDLSRFREFLDKKTSMEEITPMAFTKDKLDVAFKNRKKKTVSFTLRKIPFYQSAAAAVLCLLLGYWMNAVFEKPKSTKNIVENIVRDTIQVIEYIPSPFVTIPFSLAKNSLPPFSIVRQKSGKNIVVDTLYRTANNVFISDTNKREIAQKAIQLNKAQNIGSDSLLKRILVILY